MSLSRIETILSGGEVVPQSRIEKILVGEDVIPQSRIETLLKEKLGGGGGGTEITDGIVITSRNANDVPTSVDVYLPYIETMIFRGTGWLKSVTTANFIVPVTKIAGGAFHTANISGNYAFPALTKIDAQQSFYNCPNITGLSFPEVVYVGAENLQRMTALKTINLPKCTSWSNVDTTYAPFINCTALEVANLGSIGYSVGVMGSKCFNGCTQSGLTINLFCKGSEADTLLSNIRANATNATIIIKASEATTYSGTAYAAGDTMITSEVA